MTGGSDLSNTNWAFILGRPTADRTAVPLRVHDLHPEKRHVGAVGLQSAHLSFWQRFGAGAIFHPLAPRQRGEGQGEGYLLVASSPRPSPPQACGGEGEIQTAQKLGCARLQTIIEIRLAKTGQRRQLSEEL
jgi:hypothetical protein